MKKSRVIAKGLGLAMLLPISAFAAGTVATTQTKAPEKDFFDHLTGYWKMDFRGPAISTTDATKQPDVDTGQPSKNVIQGKQYIGLNYKFDNGVTLGPMAYFRYSPFNGGYSQMRDWEIIVANPGLYTNGNFSLYGDFRVVLPTSEASQQKTMQYALKSKQVANYNIPDSRWAIGLVGLEWFNTFQDASGESDAEIIGVPFVDFTISPTITAEVAYEMDWLHNSGQQSLILHDDSPGSTNLEAGVTFQITPTFSLNPYLEFSPTSDMGVAASNTTANFILKWVFL